MAYDASNYDVPVVSDRDSRWLKTADTNAIVNVCHSDGMIAFLCGGLTSSDIAGIATKTINELRARELMHFGSLHRVIDDSWIRSCFVVNDTNPEYHYVWIDRYDFYQNPYDNDDNEVRKIQPFLFSVDRKKAKEFVERLNNLF